MNAILGNILNFLKKYAMIELTIVALLILGNVIDGLVNWSYLTIFFKILSVLINSMNFIWDTDTMLVLITAQFTILVSYWGFIAFIWVKRSIN